MAYESPIEMKPVPYSQPESEAFREIENHPSEIDQRIAEKERELEDLMRRMSDTG